jgi:prepilin-type N-terminal cleavage/methylation domain-containing protein
MNNIHQNIKTTQGFTFIELTIALLITSIVAFMIYQSFEQTQRSVKQIDALMDYTLSMPTVYNQLGKDITALFVPERAFKELDERAKKAQKKDKPAAQAEQQNPEPDKEKKEKKLEPLKNIFYLTAKEKNFESLSFISTHSLSLYNSVVPNNVRIMYRLMPQVNGRFRLTRQEITKLGTSLNDFSSEKIRSYDLLSEIKSLSVLLFVPEKLEVPTKKEQKDQKEQQQQKPKKRVYKELNQWQFDAAETSGEQKNDYVVPAYLQFTGIVVDPVTDRERDFVWEFKVAAFDGIEDRLKEIKAQEDKEKNKQPAQDAEKKEEQQNKQQQSGLPGKPGSMAKPPMGFGQKGLKK